MLKALLISNRTDWCDFLEVALARTYDVQIVPHHLATRELMHWPSPDLVVLDIDTEDICEFSLLKWFGENRQVVSSAFIIISSNPALSQSVCAQQAGALAYLTKPFTYQELQAILPVYS